VIRKAWLDPSRHFDTRRDRQAIPLWRDDRDPFTVVEVDDHTTVPIAIARGRVRWDAIWIADFMWSMN
jgi:hypothetical protein